MSRSPKAPARASKPARPRAAPSSSRTKLAPTTKPADVSPIRSTRAAVEAPADVQERSDKAYTRSQARLGALGLIGMTTYTIGKLGELSIAELFGITYDIGDSDPAFSLMQHISDELTTLQLALRSPHASLPDEEIERVLYRLGNAAAVAGELHRRMLEVA